MAIPLQSFVLLPFAFCLALFCIMECWMVVWQKQYGVFFHQKARLPFCCGGVLFSLDPDSSSFHFWSKVAVHGLFRNKHSKGEREERVLFCVVAWCCGNIARSKCSKDKGVFYPSQILCSPFPRGTKHRHQKCGVVQGWTLFFLYKAPFIFKRAIFQKFTVPAIK